MNKSFYVVRIIIDGIRLRKTHPASHYIVHGLNLKNLSIINLVR
jgi:hypothetical protein